MAAHISQPLLIGAVALAMLLGAGVIAAVVLRRTRRALRGFSAAQGLEALEPGKTYTGELGGQPYECVYHAGSRNRPASFRVRIACPSPGDFTVGPESSFDRLFKKLGIAVEVQTGDPDFDRRFYINTNTVGFCRTYFAKGDVREAMRRIADLSYATVSLDGSTLEAVCSPFAAGKARPDGFVDEAVRALGALAADIPQAWYEPRALGMPRWKLTRAGIFVVAGLSAAGGFGLFLWGTMAYPPLDQLAAGLFSLRYSVAALVLFAIFAVLLLRGRSSSHKELLASVSIALLGFPLSGAGGLMVLNGYRDDSPPVPHQAQVVDKHYTRSRNSTNYYVHLPSWRAGHSREQIKVSSRVYQRVRPGRSVMQVTTRAGRYGFEWVDGYRLVGRAPAAHRADPRDGGG
jgi:hypothetical protein